MFGDVGQFSNVAALLFHIARNVAPPVLPDTLSQVLILCVCACVCACACVYTYVCTHTHTRARARVYIYVRGAPCTLSQVHTCMQTRTHAMLTRAAQTLANAHKRACDARPIARLSLADKHTGTSMHVRTHTLTVSPCHTLSVSPCRPLTIPLSGVPRLLLTVFPPKPQRTSVRYRTHTHINT